MIKSLNKLLSDAIPEAKKMDMVIEKIAINNKKEIDKIEPEVERYDSQNIFSVCDIPVITSRFVEEGFAVLQMANGDLIKVKLYK